MQNAFTTPSCPPPSTSVSTTCTRHSISCEPFGKSSLLLSARISRLATACTLRTRRSLRSVIRLSSPESVEISES